MTTYDQDWLPTGREVLADETITVRCCSCGREVTCTPSGTHFGRWSGTGTCGERVTVTGRPARRQNADELKRHTEGGCRERM